MPDTEPMADARKRSYYPVIWTYTGSRRWHGQTSLIVREMSAGRFRHKLLPMAADGWA
jgi:hypothetical protein